jgi:hypothetical protein
MSQTILQLFQSLVQDPIKMEKIRIFSEYPRANVYKNINKGIYTEAVSRSKCTRSNLEINVFNFHIFQGLGYVNKVSCC